MSSIIVVSQKGRVFACQNPKHVFRDTGLCISGLEHAKNNIYSLDERSFCLEMASGEKTVGRFFLHQNGNIGIDYSPSLPSWAILGPKNRDKRLVEIKYPQNPALTPYGTSLLTKPGVTPPTKPPVAQYDQREVAVLLSQSGTTLVVGKKEGGIAILRREKARWMTLVDDFWHPIDSDMALSHDGAMLCIREYNRAGVNSSLEEIAFYALSNKYKDHRKRLGSTQDLAQTTHEYGCRRIYASENGWILGLGHDTLTIAKVLRTNISDYNTPARDLPKYAHGYPIGPAIGDDIAVWNEKDHIVRWKGKPVGAMQSVKPTLLSSYYCYYCPGIGAVWLQGQTLCINDTPTTLSEASSKLFVLRG
jgi:hypothetical protein